jgi:hypothetical protein
VAPQPMAGDELHEWLGNCDSNLWWLELGQDTSRGGALQCLPLNTKRLGLVGERRRAVVPQFVVGRRNLGLAMEGWYSEIQGGNGSSVKNERTWEVLHLKLESWL